LAKAAPKQLLPKAVPKAGFRKSRAQIKFLEKT
jgi:hypothetical protein